MKFQNCSKMSERLQQNSTSLSNPPFASTSRTSFCFTITVLCTSFLMPFLLVIPKSTVQSTLILEIKIKLTSWNNSRTRA